MTGGYYPDNLAPPLDDGTSIGVMSRRDLRISSVEDCILICAKKNLIGSAHDGDVRITAGQTVALEGTKITGKAQSITMRSGSHSISSGGVTITASKVTIKADEIILDGPTTTVTGTLVVEGNFEGGEVTRVGGV